MKLSGLGIAPATGLTFTTEKQKDKNVSTKIFAWRGATCVGVAYVSLFTTNEKLPRAAYLQYFYVPREYRKKGIALALLHEVRRWLNEVRPEITYLMAKALWTGSYKVMEQAFGPYVVAADDPARLTPFVPFGDWDGVRDGPGVAFGFPVRADRKAWLREMKARALEQSASGKLTDADFSRAISNDFGRSTRYMAGSKMLSIAQ